jgi:hypothetical protein
VSTETCDEDEEQTPDSAGTVAQEQEEGGACKTTHMSLVDRRQKNQIEDGSILLHSLRQSVFTEYHREGLGYICCEYIESTRGQHALEGGRHMG